MTPVDVLIGMGLLRPEHVKDWRFSRVPYLERVINCNLSRLSRLLRILRFHAHDLNLKPSAPLSRRTTRSIVPVATVTMTMPMRAFLSRSQRASAKPPDSF